MIVLVSMTPETLAFARSIELLMDLIVGVVVAIVGGSFLEHFVHRNFMHRRRLPRFVYQLMPFLVGIFERHAIRHHGLFYKRFDDEKDPVGKFENLRVPIRQSLLVVAACLPLLIPVGLFFPIEAVMFGGWIVVHNLLQSMLHVEMHIPSRAKWRHTNVFRWLARHHFMHHQQPSRNLNIVCPLADYVLGTVARPTQGDIREMIEIGILLPSQRKRQASRS